MQTFLIFAVANCAYSPFLQQTDYEISKTIYKYN